MKKILISLCMALSLYSCIYAKVVHLDLNEHSPQPMPIHPLVTLSLRLPYPIDSIQGAGFTADPSVNQGDYLVSFTQNGQTISIFPLTQNPPARNLNILIKDKIYSLKPYLVSSPQEAWNIAIFEDPALKSDLKEENQPQITKSYVAPVKEIKTSSSAKILGMMDLTKLISQVDDTLLPSLLKTMPKVSVCLHKNKFFDFGSHRIFLDIVSRNNDYDILIFGVRVTNDSNESLALDPESFVARVGQFAYAQVLSDFKGLLEPGESSIGYFAIIGTGEGGANYLSANNDFRISLDFLKNENSDQK